MLRRLLHNQLHAMPGVPRAARGARVREQELRALEWEQATFTPPRFLREPQRPVRGPTLRWLTRQRRQLPESTEKVPILLRSPPDHLRIVRPSPILFRLTGSARLLNPAMRRLPMRRPRRQLPRPARLLRLVGRKKVLPHLLLLSRSTPPSTLTRTLDRSMPTRCHHGGPRQSHCNQHRLSSATATVPTTT